MKFYACFILCILFCCSAALSRAGYGTIPAIGRLNGKSNPPPLSLAGEVSDIPNDFACSASSIASMMKIRGGVNKKSGVEKKLKYQPKNVVNKVNDMLAQVKPVTRVYLLITLFCTLVHMTGLPAPVLFSLDIGKWYEFWRPVTSVAYLGAPSMSMANSLYFLLRYGQTLEDTSGTGPHAWFLIVQTLMLTALGLLLGFPFQGQAMIAAIVYACSRVNPSEKIPVQFGLVVQSWQLPYCMMVIDCLSQQTASAAWPHVLGILTGHVHHFYTQVWPDLGGREWLKPPAWVIRRLGGEKKSNVEGVDFRKDSTTSDSGLNRSKKATKLLSRKKGRKL